jgi:inosine/xanthosine triphosphatase
MTIPLHSRRTAKLCQFRTPSRSCSPRCSLALVTNFSHSSLRVFRDLRTLSFSGSQLSRVLPAVCALLRKKLGVHPHVVIPRLFPVDCRLSAVAVGQSRATSSISFISPAYEHQPRISFVSPTYAKTGGVYPTQKCRRADIRDFSPDILHFLALSVCEEPALAPLRRPIFYFPFSIFDSLCPTFSSPFPQTTQIRRETRAGFPVHCANRASISVNACHIAVGSTRRPKLQAVQEATASFAVKLSPHAPLEIQGHEVESGVSHTPSSREELMQGARQRAEALHKMLADSGNRADYCVGLEGGLDVAVENGTRRVFLESWAYVTDGVRGHFGCSGSIEIPELLAEEVLSRGTELSVAIDNYAGAVGIRDGQGAWGVLTDNLVSRQESFRLAVVAAFAPFYNVRMYRPAAQLGVAAKGS